MTRAVLLAAAAGALAAPALVDLLVGLRPRRRARRERIGVALLARLGRGFGARAPRGLGQKLVAAGVEATVDDVMAVKVGAALAGLACALILLPAAPGRTGVMLLAAAPAAGFLAPDVWLGRRARRRGRAMEAELADVLDLLRVAVAAGLSPARGLAEVGRRHSGPPGDRAAPRRRARSARHPAREHLPRARAALPRCRHRRRSSRRSSAPTATALRSHPRWPPRPAPPAPAARSAPPRPPPAPARRSSSSSPCCSCPPCCCWSPPPCSRRSCPRSATSAAAWPRTRARDPATRRATRRRRPRRAPRRRSSSSAGR